MESGVTARSSPRPSPGTGMSAWTMARGRSPCGAAAMPISTPVAATTAATTMPMTRFRMKAPHISSSRKHHGHRSGIGWRRRRRRGGPVARVTREEIDRLVAGEHHDPHSILGAHPGRGGTTVRALRPLASKVAVVLPDGSRHPLRHVHAGMFAVTLPEGSQLGAGEGLAVPDYRLAVTYGAEPR